MIYGVVLAGGKGERLWPLSRTTRPKQFIALGGRTLLEEAYARVAGVADEVWVVTSSSLSQRVRELLPQATVIAEPVGKNTAPVCVYTAALAVAHDPDALLIVVPSDHLIRDTASFTACAKVALDIASQGNLVTFGIVPTFPATGYGYIERGESLTDRNGIRAFRVRRFHEKPDERTALGYLESKRFFWNSGMFVWPARLFLDEAIALTPQFADCLGHSPDLQLFYEAAPAISVDYAVMERARQVAVVGATFDWEDIGSLAALDKAVRPKDGPNTVWGEVVQDGCENCFLVAEQGVVAAIGLRDLIVIRTADATLVIPLDQAHRVRELVARINENPRLRDLL